MTRRRLLIAAVATLWCLSAAAWAQWYTRPYASRYYKDDWRAEFLYGQGTWTKSFPVKEGVLHAWVQAWASEPYSLTVNGQGVGRDNDAGTVEHWDIRPLLRPGQENTITISTPGGWEPDTILEGQILYEDGTAQPIATDASWLYVRSETQQGGGAIQTGARKRRGPQEAHHAVLLEYTPEQRAKGLVSRTRATIQRIQEQGLLELRAARDARALLAGEPLDPPELVAAFEQARAEAGQKLDAALERIEAGQFDAAEPLAREAFERMAAVEAQLQRTRLQWENAALERHVLRAVDALGVRLELPPRPADSEGPEALRRYLWAIGDQAARTAQTYVSEPSWSRHNKYGWLTSCIPVGSDVGDWEVSVAPAEQGVIDLAGLWHFTTDPKNEGLAKGFAAPGFDATRWRRVQAGVPWEYQGVDQDNSYAPFDAPFEAGWSGNNKPYNGYAWYRTEVYVPESWAGGGATLRIGRAQTWSWIYVNGELAGEFTPQTGQPSEDIVLEIPAERLAAGGANTIAIRIYNAENQGGLNLEPVLLTKGGADGFAEVETRVGVSLWRAWGAPGERPHTAMLGSALSPGAYVISRTGSLTLSGWELRNVTPPNHLAMVIDGEVLGVDLGEPGEKYRASEDGPMSAPWILLWHDVADEGNPRPLLIVPDGPVERIVVSHPQDGPQTVTIEMPRPEGQAPVARFALARPLGDFTRLTSELSPLEVETLAQWVRMLRAYPVGYSELYAPAADGAAVTLLYDYAPIEDAFATEPLRIAPLPMLHALGLEHENPGLSKPPGLALVRPGGEWGGYWAVPGADRLEVSVPPHARRLLRGSSTTFMSPGGGSGEGWTQVFAHMARWGSNHVRCQIGFTIDWDLPFARTLAGPLLWEDPQVARLDRMVEVARENGLHFMANHFWGSFRDFPVAAYAQAVGPLPEGYPRRTVRMPDNSSRYWRMNPDSRAMIIEIWRRVAERYRDLPADAISYDLLNEPAYVSMDDWNAFVADCTKAIRGADPTHLIVVEAGNGWAQPADFRELRHTGDANTMYSFHWYGEHSRLENDLYYPSYRTERQRYDRARIEELHLDVIRFAIVNRVPVHSGETGISILAPARSADRWIQDYFEFCEKYDIHWSWWDQGGNQYWRTGLVAGGDESPAVPLIRRFLQMDDRNGFHPEWFPHELPEMAELP